MQADIQEEIKMSKIISAMVCLFYYVCDSVFLCKEKGMVLRRSHVTY